VIKEFAVTDEQRTVLVIDADLALHEIVQNAVAKECTVLGARTRALGVTIAGRRPPDVVFVDASVEDPAALVGDLRALNANVRVIFLVPPDLPHAEVSLLSPLGTVLARRVDAERVRSAVRSATRLAAMNVDVQRMRTGSFARGKLPR